MKKLSLLSLAFAALLMTGCRKSNVQPLNGGNGVGPFGDYEMTLSASNGGDEKSSIEGLKINYQLGDKLHVVDATNGYLGYLTATSVSGTSGTFKGFITKPGVGHNCMFYFVGTNDFGLDGDNYTFDVHEQYGGLSVYVGNVVNDDYENGGTWKGGIDDVSNGLQLMKSKAAVEVTQTMLDAHNFGSQAVQMRSMMAISRLNLQVNGTSMGGELTDSVTVSGAGCYSTGTLNIKTGILTPVPGNITLKKANGDYYMVLIPANQTEGGSNLALTFTATSRNNESVSITKPVAANKFYNSGGAWAVNMVTALPPGTLSGVFTVGPLAKNKVRFSQGNLYYDNDAAAGKKWNFESHQYDFRTYSDGTNVGTAVINGTYTTTETCDWGLFGWSTNASGNNYGMSTSISSIDYSGSFVDWGGNTIYAGGVATTGWRTLRYGEMDTLLFYRSTGVTVSDVLNARYSKVEVNGVNGLLVYPDSGFTWNETTMGTAPANTNVNAAGVDFPDTYTAAQFQKMEEAGAVFLPAAGYRLGSGVYYVGSVGYYWSSTPHEDYEDLAYYLYFGSDDVNAYDANRYRGYCVRLVR